MRSTPSGQRINFADVLRRVVPRDGLGAAEVAADPVRAVGAVRDDDRLSSTIANHAAVRQLRDAQRVLEALKPGADGEHGAQIGRRRP